MVCLPANTFPSGLVFCPFQVSLLPVRANHCSFNSCVPYSTTSKRAHITHTTRRRNTTPCPTPVSYLLVACDTLRPHVRPVFALAAALVPCRGAEVPVIPSSSRRIVRLVGAVVVERLHEAVLPPPRAQPPTTCLFCTTVASPPTTLADHSPTRTPPAHAGSVSLSFSLRDWTFLLISFFSSRYRVSLLISNQQ